MKHHPLRLRLAGLFSALFVIAAFGSFASDAQCQSPTGAPSITGQPADPFAVAAISKYTGRYESADRGVQLRLKSSGGRLVGRLVFKGVEYDITASPGGDGVEGEFGAGGDRWPFSLASDGTNMSFRTADAPAVAVVRKAMKLPPGIYKSGAVWLAIKEDEGERTGLLRFGGQEYPFTGRLEADEFSAATAGFTFSLADTDDPSRYLFRSGAYRENLAAVTGDAVLDDPTLPKAYANEKLLAQKRAEEAALRVEKENHDRAEALISQYGETLAIPLGFNTTIVLVAVRPGSFTMGTPMHEPGFDPYEDNFQYQHRVTLTKACWLGKYEVTLGQWQAVMGNNPITVNIFKPTSSDEPIRQVSWDDAMAFCRKLTEQERAAGRLPTGYEYSLPTEAQWEYACRAGTTSGLNNGTEVTSREGPCGNLDKVGWYGYNGRGEPHNVGQKQPNAWGLYDMHGNVMEWCYDSFIIKADKDVIDPVDLENGNSEHVVRGGCCNYIPSGCRSGSRFDKEHSYAFADTGFRLALRSVQ